MLMIVYVKGRQVQFDSPHTHVTAHVKLNMLTRDGGKLHGQEFPTKLAAAKLSKMSPLQVAWMHKLVVDAEAPPPPPPVGIPENLIGVVQLFDRAATKLKRPRISLVVEYKGEKFTVDLQRTSAQSKYGEGCVYVTDGGGYGNSTWYARIDREGVVTPSRNINDAIRLTLAKMSLDPAGFAREYGIASGHCCFCNKGLIDPRSTAVGFGPVCAENFGLKDEWNKFWRTAEAKSAGGIALVSGS